MKQSWLTAVGVALVLGGCASTSGMGGASDGSRYLYAANQSAATISVIDADRFAVVETVSLEDLGFSINAKPHHIVVEPDGSHWYVSLIGENRVLKFDRANRLVAQAQFEVPGMLALHPSRDLLLVGRSMAAVNPPTRVGRIVRSTMETEELDVFFPRPHALAVGPDEVQLYSASLAVNQMGALNLETENLELIELDGATHTLVQFAVSPDGASLVATGQMTGRLLVFDIRAPNQPRLVKEVEVGQHPWHPVFTPDGRYVYFGNKQSNSVSVVETASWEQVAEIRHPAISEPHGSAVSPDGRYVFISSNNTAGGYGGPGSGGTVVVIDTARREVVRVIDTGAYTAGLGIGRDT